MKPALSVAYYCGRADAIHVPLLARLRATAIRYGIRLVPGRTR